MSPKVSGRGQLSFGMVLPTQGSLGWRSQGFTIKRWDCSVLFYNCSMALNEAVFKKKKSWDPAAWVEPTSAITSSETCIIRRKTQHQSHLGDVAKLKFFFPGRVLENNTKEVGGKCAGRWVFKNLLCFGVHKGNVPKERILPFWALQYFQKKWLKLTANCVCACAFKWAFPERRGVGGGK